MTIEDGFFLAFLIVGGLALFLLGMSLMTDGLRAAVGERLRELLRRGTCKPTAALGLGSMLGFLAHSSAATVMTVGFLNAGLLSLAQSVPVFIGANIGTTLSMQLISFRLSDYAYAAVAVGFFIQLLVPNAAVKSCGRAVMGFGLLFWGMETMSGAIEPHREFLAQHLSAVDGSTWSGMLYGLLLATLITLVIQSSGAVIGICFALASAGVFVSLEQVFPIILGAHIGTSSTSLAASIGANRDARRGAVSNLFFNVFNVALALALAPVFLWLVPLLSSDLVHQIAHLHTAVMVVAAIVLMPLLPGFVRLLRCLIPVRDNEGSGSNLDYGLVPMPENALRAVMRELGRSLDFSAESLGMVRRLLGEFDTHCVRRVQTNEATINELKDAVNAYVGDLLGRYLSRRQALLAQYLIHISSDVERVGDHIEHLCASIVDQRKRTEARYDDTLRDYLQGSIDDALAVLDETRSSLNSYQLNYASAAAAILTACERYSKGSMKMRQSVDDRVARHEVTAIAGVFCSDFGLSLDRMVRHCRMIANEQNQPFFSLKESKLDAVEPPLREKRLPDKLLEGESHRERAD